MHGINYDFHLGIRGAVYTAIVRMKNTVMT